jgi:hypothetical protein
VQNVPYCKATVDLKVGMGVVIDRAAKTVSLPEDAKTAYYIVTNINDKPELHNSPETYVVNAGEYVRADDLRTVNGQEIELAAYEIDGGTDDLNEGEMLVFDTTGLIKKTDDATGYAVAFKVIAKTAYMFDGILAEIVAQ